MVKNSPPNIKLHHRLDKLFSAKDILVLVLNNVLEVLNYSATFEENFNNKEQVNELLDQLRVSLISEEYKFSFKKDADEFAFEVFQYSDPLLSINRLILIGQNGRLTEKVDTLATSVSEAMQSLLVEQSINQKVFLASLKNLVRSLPGSAHIKSLDGFKYIASNQGTIDLFGLGSESALIGLDDYKIARIMKQRWPDRLADEIRNYDLNILESQKALTGIKETPYLNAAGKLIVHHLNKMPVLSRDGSPFGILTIAFDMCALKDIAFIRNTYKMIYLDSKQAHVKFLEHIQVGGKPNQNSISSREFDCLELLAQGNSAKEIGLLLNISFRTVEMHIERLKNKLGCFFKNELIDYYYNIQKVVQAKNL